MYFLLCFDFYFGTTHTRRPVGHKLKCEQYTVAEEVLRLKSVTQQLEWERGKGGHPL